MSAFPIIPVLFSLDVLLLKSLHEVGRTEWTVGDKEVSRIPRSATFSLRFQGQNRRPKADPYDATEGVQARVGRKASTTQTNIFMLSHRLLGVNWRRWAEVKVTTRSI